MRAKPGIEPVEIGAGRRHREHDGHRDDSQVLQEPAPRVSCPGRRVVGTRSGGAAPHFLGNRPATATTVIEAPPRRRGCLSLPAHRHPPAPLVSAVRQCAGDRPAVRRHHAFPLRRLPSRQLPSRGTPVRIRSAPSARSTIQIRSSGLSRNPHPSSREVSGPLDKATKVTP
jgi:hypothetical protein